MPAANERRERGAAAIEFLVFATVMLAFLTSTLSVMRYIHASQVAADAAEFAARAATVDGRTGHLARARDRAVAEASGNGLRVTAADVTVTGGGQGQPITVTVRARVAMFGVLGSATVVQSRSYVLPGHAAHGAPQ